MKTYARIQDGHVVEIIEPMLDAEGNEIPIEQRFHPDFVAMLAAVLAGTTVGIGYSYDGANFKAPAAPPAPTAAQVIASYESALSSGLDAGAKAWGYDSIVSAASYAASTNAQFKAEAVALVAWRDAVWVWAAAQLAAVQGGTEAMPATADAFVASMPAQPARPKV